MKTIVLKIIILIILLISGSIYSQDLRSKIDTIQKPIKTELNGSKGLFITFRFMDSLSVKLIDRKSIMKENKTLGRLSYKLKSEVKELEKKNAACHSTNFANWRLFQTEKQKNILLNSNIEAQKEITISIKKKARKNGLLLFGGGIIIGMAGFALLIL